MKKITLFVLIIALFSGCTKKEEKKTETEKPKTEANDTTLSKHSGEAVKKNSENPDAADSLSDIKYGIKDIPKSLDFSGKIVASASWKDKNGNNILLITKQNRRK